MTRIDKYAKDAREWRAAAEGMLEAATLLFNLNNPFVWFAAAILGHHALEMLLKSALIREGCTVAKGKTEEGFVWGHNLQYLAKLLASRRQDFSLQIASHLARYDTFFNELVIHEPRQTSILSGQDEKKQSF